jgi:hypothetical protein
VQIDGGGCDGSRLRKKYELGYGSLQLVSVKVG